MAGVDPVNRGSGSPNAGNKDDSTVDLGRRGQPRPTARAPFEPGGRTPPSRESGEPAQGASGPPQFRAGTPTSRLNLPAPEELVQRGYSQATLKRLASAAGGPPALEALRSIHLHWSGIDRSSVRQLHLAASLLDEAPSENKEDTRPQTLVALLKSHAGLTQWGCANDDLLEIAGWFNHKNDPDRTTALEILHNNREWLEQHDYQPIDILPLAERPDFQDIMGALHEHHQPLRDAGFSSSAIAEAARNDAGAASVAALAARHQPLVELGCEPAQLARFASIYGPGLIDLLASQPELIKAHGPLGIGPLIATIDDETSEGVLAGLRAKIAALPPEPPEPPKPRGLQRLAERLGIRRRNVGEE